mgnify:CR=1 FL=1
MQNFLSLLRAVSQWVNIHLGWFLTNGNKQAASNIDFPPSDR